MALIILYIKMPMRWSRTKDHQTLADQCGKFNEDVKNGEKKQIQNWFSSSQLPFFDNIVIYWESESVTE